MKKIFFLLTILLISSSAFAQLPPDRFRDGLDIPFIQLDTLTTTQRDALVIPSNKTRFIYNKTVDSLQYYNLGTSSWKSLGGGGGTTPNLQQVTDVGNTSTNLMQADELVVHRGVANESYELTERGVTLGFPVVTARPKTADKVIAFDIMPNGTVVDNGNNGVAWLDIVDTDAKGSNPSLSALRLGIGTTRGTFGMLDFNGATAKPLDFVSGTAGNTVGSIGTNGHFNWLTDVNLTNTTASNLTLNSDNTSTIRVNSDVANGNLASFSSTLTYDGGLFQNSTRLQNDTGDLILQTPTDDIIFITGGGLMSANEGFRLASDGTVTAKLTTLATVTAEGNKAVLNKEAGDGLYAPISVSGDVTKVGVPVNNQIGIWTGDGTLEGDANFTWDGTSASLSSATPRISVNNTGNFRSGALWSDNILFSRDGFNLTLQTPTLTGNYTLNLPALTANSTIALTSDFSNYLTLDGSQTITGSKTFNTGDSSSNIISNNSSAAPASGIYATNTSNGRGLEIVNSSTGIGLFSNNTSTGVGIQTINASTGTGLFITNSDAGDGLYVSNSSTGEAIVAASTSLGTGLNFVGKDQSTITFSVDINGNVTANTFVKSGGTGSDVLLDDGTTTPLSGLGGGDVTKVGTPVNGQVGVYTGDGTLGGFTDFVRDPTTGFIGINTPNPLESLHVTDGFLLDHTATSTNDHAMEINFDAAGFGDAKALDIVYTTGAITTGGEESAILLNIDESASTGGELFGLEVLSTSVGSTDVYALKTGVQVAPISQFSGTFVNASSILVLAVDQLTPLSTGGAGNISVFIADNDDITIGSSSKFGELELIVDTPASGSGIAPTFEYSTGVGTWATFTPVDGTNGFRNTGAVLWDEVDLASWAVGTGGEFLIRITRTRNSLGTTPILDLIQIAAIAEYKWDKNGDITANSFIGDGSGLTGIDDTLSQSSTITTSRNALLTDADGMNVSTASGDVTITIPSNSSVAFPIGTVLVYQSNNDGNILIRYAVGVTGEDGQTYENRRLIRVWKTATDTWQLIDEPVADQESITLVCSDLVTDITTGTSKQVYFLPFDFFVEEVIVTLDDPGTTTGITVDINNNGTSILSTLLTTDAGENTSESPVTPAVISTNQLDKFDKITVDFDAVPTSATGVQVHLNGFRHRTNIAP